jgi:signal transduction histidine kinase
MQQLAEESQLSFIKEIESNLWIHGDTDYLIRVFVNLLDNAIKYTPEKGKVTVQASSHGAEVCVVVSDTGQGIGSDHLTHLFERFYRVDPARSRSVSARESGQTGGTGLGLAIANEIVRFHRGSLTVQSQPTKGSIFTIRLPVSTQK